MKFKKNVIPLGSSRVSSVFASNPSSILFFMAADGVIVRKSFDLANHKLASDSSVTAYASSFVKLNSGCAFDIGELVFQKD